MEPGYKGQGVWTGETGATEVLSKGRVLYLFWNFGGAKLEREPRDLEMDAMVSGRETEEEVTSNS